MRQSNNQRRTEYVHRILVVISSLQKNEDFGPAFSQLLKRPCTTEPPGVSNVKDWLKTEQPKLKVMNIMLCKIRKQLEISISLAILSSC